MAEETKKKSKPVSKPTVKDEVKPAKKPVLLVDASRVKLDEQKPVDVVPELNSKQRKAALSALGEASTLADLKAVVGRFSSADSDALADEVSKAVKRVVG